MDHQVLRALIVVGYQPCYDEVVPSVKLDKRLLEEAKSNPTPILEKISSVALLRKGSTSKPGLAHILPIIPNTRKPAHSWSWLGVHQVRCIKWRVHIVWILLHMKGWLMMLVSGS